MKVSPKKQYDVCLVLLQSAVHDARTLNIAESAVLLGKSVCVIALGTAEEQKHIAATGVSAYFLQCSPIGKLWKRWILFLWFAWHILRAIRVRQIWAEDVFCLPLCAVIARLQSATLLYDSREIFSALGALSTHRIKQNIITWIERSCIGSVHTVIVSGQRDAEFLAEYFHREVPTVVMNVPKRTPHIRTSLLRDTYHIPADQTILLYQGAVSHGRGILPVMKALPFIEHVVFCILGDGEQKQEFMRFAEENALNQRVFFCSKVPYHTLPQWTASADIGLTIIEPISFSYSLALPNKLFEYAMAGLPVIASSLPAIRDILDAVPFGLCVEDFEPQTIAAVIKTMLEPNEYAQYRSQALHARECYAWEAQESILQQLFSH